MLLFARKRLSLSWRFGGARRRDRKAVRRLDFCCLGHHLLLLDVGSGESLMREK